MLSRLGKTPAMLLVIATCIVGYGTFRYFYHVGDNFPFSQELILVFIGTIATILITAILLNQQTELELKKEGQVLLLEQKSDIYFALIEHIGEIVEQNKLDEPALNELRVLNHKLAMIGSPEVIRHFNTVLDALEKATRDETIVQPEEAEIMRKLAELTFFIRKDLLGITGAAEDTDRIYQDIVANNRDLER